MSNIAMTIYYICAAAKIFYLPHLWRRSVFFRKRIGHGYGRAYWQLWIILLVKMSAMYSNVHVCVHIHHYHLRPFSQKSVTMVQLLLQDFVFVPVCVYASVYV